MKRPRLLETKRVVTARHHVRTQFEGEGVSDPATDIGEEDWEVLEVNPKTLDGKHEFIEALEVVQEQYHETDEARFRTWVDTRILKGG